MKVLRKDQLQIGVQLLVIVLLIRYGLFKTLGVEVALSDFEFILFIVSFGFIYSGGLLLFAILRQEKHPEKIIVKNIDRAYYTYLGLNTIGIGISFFLANEIGNVGYFGFFIALAALLYLYITQWIKIPLLSNIIFACIAAYPIFTGIILDLVPRIEIQNPIYPYMDLFSILFSFSILTTLLFFIKTLVLDLKHVDDDRYHNKKTLATMHGIEKGAIRTSFLIYIPILCVGIFVFQYFNKLQLLSLYCLIAIIVPLFFAFIQLNRAKEIKQFNTSNNILNAIIWLTIISIVFLFFNIKYYVTS